MSDDSTDTPPDFAGQAREAHQAIAAIHEQAQQQLSRVKMSHETERDGVPNPLPS